MICTPLLPLQGALNDSAYFIGAYTFPSDVYRKADDYDFALGYLVLTGALLLGLFLYIIKECVGNVAAWSCCF